MKRSQVSLILLVIFSLLFLVLSACGSNDSNQTGKIDQGGNSDSGNGKTSDSEPADPLGKYPEIVTVSEVLGYNPPEDPKTPSGISPDQNAYLKDLKEQLNIDLKYTWTVPADQFEQKFSLAIASGELPDVMELDMQKFERFKNLGLLADLSDVYDQYASPMLKEFVEADGGDSKKLLTSDGKLLGIPKYGVPPVQLLWIRSDWLKKVKMEPPKTIDELEQLAEAFIKLNSNQSNAAEVYGIAMQKNLFFWAFDSKGFFNGFHSYPGAWIKGQDGKLVAGDIQPETKSALAKLQDWYKKGLLDKEFALKDDNKAVEDIVAGKVGIVYGEWWYPNWPLNLNKDKDPDADWICLPIPSIDGTPGKSIISRMAPGSAIVVNSKFKHPEAAIKMINFYIDMNSKKNMEKNKAENGYVYNWFTPRVYNPLEMETIYTEVNKALENNQSEVNENVPYYTNIQSPLEAARKFLDGDKSGWGLYFSRVAENGGWGLTSKLRGSNQFVYNEFFGIPTETMGDKGAQLDKLTNETFTKIIMGAKIDDFDKYVESWKALGGDDITEEVNEWYEKNGIK
ncbi:extracellular solute-binding protein [Paenibacillus sp. GCM10027626]|uniref:extracellular solute-binding protein n=1 Tax=Paenibacillus sp. GCM10027626 TaxID=3273411 RepID=UPI0036441D58